MEEPEEPDLESEVWTWMKDAKRYCVVDVLYSYEDQCHKVRLISQDESEFLTVPLEALESWFIPLEKVEQPEEPIQPAYS